MHALTPAAADIFPLNCVIFLDPLSRCFSSLYNRGLRGFHRLLSCRTSFVLTLPLVRRVCSLDMICRRAAAFILQPSILCVTCVLGPLSSGLVNCHALVEP